MWMRACASTPQSSFYKADKCTTSGQAIDSLELLYAKDRTDKVKDFLQNQGNNFSSWRIYLEVMYQLMHVACFKSLIEDNKIIGGGNLDTYITTRQRSSRNFEKECTWCFQVYSFFLPPNIQSCNRKVASLAHLKFNWPLKNQITLFSAVSWLSPACSRP